MGVYYFLCRIVIFYNDFRRSQYGSVGPCWRHRHCEPSEAIHLSVREVTMDCFAEPVIGRAFARPVGSQ
jgi:hypothetical protein